MGKRLDKSVRAHREHFVDFARWARELEREAELQGKPRTVLQMPIDPRDIAAYARWLDDDRGLAMSTIRTYMASIGALHVAANLFNPTSSDAVKSTMAELRNKHAEDELRRARALSDAELESIFNVLYVPRITRGRQTESLEGAHKRADVDKALLLSMVWAGMRRSEAASLPWSRVEHREGGAGMVLLPVDWGSEKYQWVPVSEECLEALMAIKPTDAPRDSKVFNLSGSQINRRLKRMCEEAEIDSKDISGDTPRATLQRVMVENNAPVDAVNAQLRLKPPLIPAIYTRIEDEQDLDWMEDLKLTVGYVDSERPRHNELDVIMALCQIFQGMMHGCSVDMGPVRAIYGDSRLWLDILITAPGRAPVGLEVSLTPPYGLEAEVAPAHGVQADALSILGLKAAVDRRDIEVLIALRYPFDLATAYDLDAALVEAKLHYCFFMGNADENGRFPESGWLEGSVSDIADFARLIMLR